MSQAQEAVESLIRKRKESQDLAIKIRKHAADLNEFADHLESGCIREKAKITYMAQATRRLLFEYNQIRTSIQKLATRLR